MIWSSAWLLGNKSHRFQWSSQPSNCLGSQSKFNSFNSFAWFLSCWQINLVGICCLSDKSFKATQIFGIHFLKCFHPKGVKKTVSLFSQYIWPNRATYILQGSITKFWETQGFAEIVLRKISYGKVTSQWTGGESVLLPFKVYFTLRPELKKTIMKLFRSRTARLDMKLKLKV